MMVSHSMSDVARLAQRLLVMNNASLAMDGTPIEVFSHAQELIDMGLDIPELTRMFLILQQKGILVNQVYTVDQAIAEIKRLKGGSDHA
jgi:energy-coupling factor transport system ATP-binding protein